jgi:hypothetical protein
VQRALEIQHEQETRGGYVKPRKKPSRAANLWTVLLCRPREFTPICEKGKCRTVRGCLYHVTGVLAARCFLGSSPALEKLALPHLDAIRGQISQLYRGHL